MMTHSLDALRAALLDGRAIPYLGPGVLDLAAADCPVPRSPQVLVERLTAKVSVPGKIRNNLTAAAQFIENFKHRRTLSKALVEAFGHAVPSTELHDYLAALPRLPLLVHAWYDDLPQRALQARDDWAVLQGLSQAEHFGQWMQAYAPDGTPVQIDVAAGRSTLLYQPLGSVAPAANFLVSDSDFVEVLTEIDIQTPIPEVVQQRRCDRHFLFLGCRFSTQIERIFARQIMKRSSTQHWAVIPGELTRNERRFLGEQGIEHVDLPLADFMAWLAASAPASVTAPEAAA